MSTIWKAVGDKMLIKKNQQQRQTASGILLPDKVKAGLESGEVLAVGPEAKNAVVGDTAIYMAAGAVEVTPGITSVSAEYVMAVQRDIAD